MNADTLTAVSGALADPTRRAIIRRLTEGDAQVSELAVPFWKSTLGERRASTWSGSPPHRGVAPRDDPRRLDSLVRQPGRHA
jgi:DNA-binding transcriptional ArsR family regulator